MQKENRAAPPPIRANPLADQLLPFYVRLDGMMAERARVRASGSTVTSAPA
jgi:hypothetical protein